MACGKGDTHSVPILRIIYAGRACSPPLPPLGNMLRDRTGGRSEMISCQSGAERSQMSLLWPVVSQSSTQVFPKGKNRRRVRSGIAHTRLANTVWLGRSLLYLVLLGQIVLMCVIALGVHLVKLKVLLTPRPLVTVVTFDGLTVVVWGVTGASCKFLIELQPLRNLTLDMITAHSFFYECDFFFFLTQILYSVKHRKLATLQTALLVPFLVCFFSVSVCRYVVPPSQA